MPTQIPKPTYEVQWSTAKMLPTPKTIIKAPNTICARAKPRKADARYAMDTDKMENEEEVRE